MSIHSLSDGFIRELSRFRSSTLSPTALLVSECVLFVLAYTVLSEIRIFSHLGSSTSLWYSISGLIFALLYGESVRFAPLVFFCLLFHEAQVHGIAPASLPALTATALIVLLYVIAAMVLRRLMKPGAHLIRIRELWVFLGVVTGLSLGISLVDGWMALHRGAMGRDLRSWLVSNGILGNAIGILSVASFLVFYVIPEVRRWRKRELEPESAPQLFKRRRLRSRGTSRLEYALQVLSVPCSVYLISRTIVGNHFDLFYLLFLPVVWIAVRQGIQGTALAILFLNTGVTVVLSDVNGPESVLKIQTLMLVITATGLFLGTLATERAQSQNELAERTTYLHALLENNPLAIVVHSREGIISLVNPAFERMFGFSKAEVQGRQVDKFVRSAEPTGEEATLTTRIVNGEPIHLQTSRLRNDGQAVRVELHGVPLVVDDELVGGIGIYKDISDQARLEEELLISQKLQAVGQLAGGVAHDFNNILGIIQGYSESLCSQIATENPMRESIDEILLASKRATSLTRQLLAFGRKQVIQPRILDLNASVEEMTRMLRRLIGEDIEFSIVAGRELGGIKADPSQLEQILLNLVVNARDAMPSGGKLTIETGNVYLHEQYKATFAPVPPGKFVMLAVCDSGIGMSPETRAKIFDPFFTTKEKGKGTGLGLATVYGIIQQAGGHIRVDSDLGEGSAFRIFFPEIDQEVSQAAAPIVSDNIPGGTETILLLEDEASFRKMTGAFLERIGYTVLVAESANEATGFAQLHSKQIHLMLTDVIMPDISGPKLAKFLTVIRPDMRVLFMSGYTDGALAQREVLASDVAFIQKPFSWSSLALKIRETIEVVEYADKKPATN